MRFLSAMMIGLLLASAGCAGPQRAVLPPGDDLPDGHRVLRVGNFGYVEETIPEKEILTISLNGGETAGSATKRIGEILLVTVLVFAVAFAAVGSFGGN